MSFSYCKDLTFKEAKHAYNDVMELRMKEKNVSLIHIHAKVGSLIMLG